MQGLPSKGLQRVAGGREASGLGAEPGTVGLVAQNRMADRARCTRIWWVRPVSSRQLDQARDRLAVGAR